MALRYFHTMGVDLAVTAAQELTTTGGRMAGTQSISRALAVLNVFCDGASDLGVVEVAERSGLSLSTAHRITRALVTEGYLAQQEGRERYRLGQQALLLGRAAQRRLGMELARPVLRALATRTGESVNLGLLDGNSAVVVQREESSHALRFSIEVGTRIALHASSMGKSLLAFNEDLGAYLDQLEDDDLIPLTGKTHANIAGLRADLAEIRQRGWSVDDEESMLGVRCVAAPVLDSTGKARAAVAIQAPAVRMPDKRLLEFGPQVLQAAEELARLLPL